MWFLWWEGVVCTLPDATARFLAKPILHFSHFAFPYTIRQGPIRGSVHLFSLLSSHLVLLSCLSYRLIFCGNLQLLKQRRPHWLKLSQKSLLTTTKMRPFWWFSNTVRSLLQKVDIPKVPRHRQKILCNKSLENLYFMTIGFSDIFPLTSIEMSSYPQQKTSWKLKPVIVMWNQNSLAKGEEARTRGTFKSHITPGFSPLCSFNNPNSSGVKNFFLPHHHHIFVALGTAIKPLEE